MAQETGKVAIITGAASGIGEAAVRLFAREGWRVMMGDIQDQRGDLLARELGSAVAFQRTDVCEDADVKRLVDTAVSRFGRLDAIFNNAGAPGVSGPIADTSVDGFDRTMALLLKSVFLGIRHAAPILSRQGSGSIVSTASVAGLRTGFGPHVYSTAKAAVIHLTKSVAMELGEKGVRVNCICPGGIATPIFGKALGLSAEQADKTVEPMKARLAQMQPIRRAGLPEDIAQAALWLCSEASGFVNGHALVVDGGLTGGRGWSEVLAQRSAMLAGMGSGG